VRDHEAGFRARGARVAAIGLGDVAYARAFRRESAISFPLLVDAERQAYRAAELRSAPLLHVLRPDNIVAGLRGRFAGYRQHPKGPHPFQLGGSFVLGPGDVDRYAHVSETFGDIAPVTALLAALHG
jgi:hypothetical protein